MPVRLGSREIKPLELVVAACVAVVVSVAALEPDTVGSTEQRPVGRIIESGASDFARELWPVVDDFGRADQGYPLVEERQWALRFYWVTRQSSYQDDYDEQEVYTKDGLYIGAFPERYIKALRMEGTGLLSDGRVINYHGKCDYGVGTCFQVLDRNSHPFGRGAGTRALVPFKSVAIDSSVVEIGEPLYIPEFDGLRMPDGRVHDGCVRADDTGGNIKNRKLDFFVESWDNWRFVLDSLYGEIWITPHVEHPRCEYLRAR